jgi:NDP-sugar pyrophosphorylase family protein
MQPTLLVLAAGMGSRYGGLKQIDPVGPHGETIMDYSVYDALRAGFGQIVFVIRRDILAAFQETIGARFEKHAPVDYVFQDLEQLPPGFAVPPGRTKPWGTTHAILAAAGAIKTPFAAINADDFYSQESYRLLAAHLSAGDASAAMAGFTLRNTLSEFGAVARGVCQVDDRGCLREIVEMTKIARHGADILNTEVAGEATRLTGDEVVSMNFWGFSPAVFPLLEASFAEFLRERAADLKSECYIPSTVNDLVAAGKLQVRVFRAGGSWFGVTYREDRSRVVASIRALIERGDYPERLWP